MSKYFTMDPIVRNADIACVIKHNIHNINLNGVRRNGVMFYECMPEFDLPRQVFWRIDLMLRGHPYAVHVTEYDENFKLVKAYDFKSTQTDEEFEAAEGWRKHHHKMNHDMYQL